MCFHQWQDRVLLSLYTQYLVLGLAGQEAQEMFALHQRPSLNSTWVCGLSGPFPLEQDPESGASRQKKTVGPNFILFFFPLRTTVPHFLCIAAIL